MTFDEWWKEYCKTHNYISERDRACAKRGYAAGRRAAAEECAEIATHEVRGCVLDKEIRLGQKIAAIRERLA